MDDRQQSPIRLPYGLDVHGFELEAYLGTGWEGTAYLARERLSGIRRVVKFYRMRGTTNTRWLGIAARRYEALSSTGMVPRYHHCGELVRLRGCALAYMVIDYLEGPLLKPLLDSPWRRSARVRVSASMLVSRLAEMLSVLHQAGFVATDIEHGNNILLLEAAYPRLFDPDLNPKKPGHDFAYDLILLERMASRMIHRGSTCEALQSTVCVLREGLTRTVNRNTIAKMRQHFNAIE